MAGTLAESTAQCGTEWIKESRSYACNMGLVLVVVLACHGALARMGGQWFEPGFNPSGLVTMGAALLFACHRAWVSRRDSVSLGWPWIGACAVLVASYGLLYGVTPRLVTSLVAVLAVTVVLLGALPHAERRVAWGLLPWMLASLPLGVAVNLYFGFPLRVLVGWLASALMLGQVTPLGTGLSDGTHTVFVDAPCSGIQMLRVAVLLAGIVAVLYRLRIAGTVGLCLSAILLAVVGNTSRVCMLFLLTRRGDVSEWLHTWSGVSIFAGCALSLVFLGSVLQRWQGTGRVRVVANPGGQSRVHTMSRIGLALAAMFAFLVPFAGADTAHKGGASIPWPGIVDGERFIESPPDPALESYRTTFLGTMVQGRLDSSGRLVLLRQCVEPTLTLHTSENCYVVAGFKCSALSAERDGQGHLWSRFSAVHPDGRAYVVKQCFFSIDGAATADTQSLDTWTAGRPSWPDSSSWYWAAARPGAEVGHTLAVTIAERGKGS